jgi:hypothetical protein
MKKPFVIFSKRLERGTILWLCICVFTIFLPRILMFYTKPNLSYTWHYQMEYKAQEAEQVQKMLKNIPLPFYIG